jgi:D-arabinose 5-phosphate isomerase GutQ
MAFAHSGLSRLGGNAASQVHNYASADTNATIVANGYFNDAAGQLNKGDVILAVGSTGGTPTVDTLVVTTARGVTPVIVARETDA